MRLVDADAFFNDFPELKNYEHASQEYEVDAEPVKHGEWRYDEALELEWCSECGFGKRKGDKRWYSYCPNCGAKNEVKNGKID